jgi:hypothetical protein
MDIMVSISISEEQAMYQVIKITNGNIEVISTHKQEQAAKNKQRRLAGAGFSMCWGVTYAVREA